MTWISKQSICLLKYFKLKHYIVVQIKKKYCIRVSAAFQHITMTLFVFLSVFEVMQALFTLKQASLEKYFLKASGDTEVKSQVVILPKVLYKSPLSSKPSCRGKGAYCDILGGNIVVA